MFNLKTALSSLSQETYFGWNGIKFELADIVWNNRANLAPGFSTHDLFSMAVEHGYIRSYSDGTLEVWLS